MSAFRQHGPARLLSHSSATSPPLFPLPPVATAHFLARFDTPGTLQRLRTHDARFAEQRRITSHHPPHVCREIMKAIESKQVASQEAEWKQYLVQRAEQEQIASVTRVEGEAEAATIITAAMKLGGTP